MPQMLLIDCLINDPAFASVHPNVDLAGLLAGLDRPIKPSSCRKSFMVRLWMSWFYIETNTTLSYHNNSIMSMVPTPAQPVATNPCGVWLVVTLKEQSWLHSPHVHLADASPTFGDVAACAASLSACHYIMSTFTSCLKQSLILYQMSSNPKPENLPSKNQAIFYKGVVHQYNVYVSSKTPCNSMGHIGNILDVQGTFWYYGKSSWCLVGTQNSVEHPIFGGPWEFVNGIWMRELGQVGNKRVHLSEGSSS